MRRNNCPNTNHRRDDAPVRYCPMCGEVVNGNAPIKECKAETHAIRRLERSTYCVDCGEKLIEAR